MTRPVALLPIFFIGLVANGAAEDITPLVQSPMELATFVQNHANFDWTPLWKTLGLTVDSNLFMPSCREESGPGDLPCKAELVNVSAPRQLILIIENRNYLEAYLRYQPTTSNSWRLSGLFTPSVKYFEPTHHVVNFGRKPFLVVTEQGSAGSGISTEVQQWIDLTATHFEPVFHFTSGGHKAAFSGEEYGRRVSGAVVSMTTIPVERIRVVMSLGFTLYNQAMTDESVVLGTRRDTITYTRTASGKFEIDPSLSTATAGEVQKLYGDLDSEFSDKEFLRLNFNGFMSVAQSGDAFARRWLLTFLRRQSDSSESQRLKAMLASRH